MKYADAAVILSLTLRLAGDNFTQPGLGFSTFQSFRGKTTDDAPDAVSNDFVTLFIHSGKTPKFNTLKPFDDPTD